MKLRIRRSNKDEKMRSSILSVSRCFPSELTEIFVTASPAIVPQIVSSPRKTSPVAVTSQTSTRSGFATTRLWPSPVKPVTATE